MTLHKKRLPSFALTPTLLMAFVAVAGPSDFEITRHTIDGGGEMRSTGNDFELSGTIGQPDVGVMTGDDFELSGGLWFPILPTDCNDDGGVNLLDHSAFEGCLTGPGVEIMPGCGCYDVNRSGTVDMLDFAAAQVFFTGF